MAATSSPFKLFARVLERLETVGRVDEHDMTELQGDRGRDGRGTADIVCFAPENIRNQAKMSNIFSSRIAPKLTGYMLRDSWNPRVASRIEPGAPSKREGDVMSAGLDG